MKIESKHNPEIFKAEHIERWNRLWKEKVFRQYIYLVSAICFLIIAIYLIKDTNPTGYIFLSIALFGIYVTINYLTHVKKQRKGYISQLDKMSERHQQFNTPISWELNDEYIHYEDFQMTLRLKWHAFSHYYVKNDSIFIVMIDSNDSPISINKKEVTEQEFTEVIKFVGSKLRTANAKK